MNIVSTRWIQKWILSSCNRWKISSLVKGLPCHPATCHPRAKANPSPWARRDLRQGIAHADVVAFYVPMHTATRIAAHVVQHVKALNPRAHLCFYGLYAPMNEVFLRGLGAGTVLGGEFETGLLALIRRLQTAPEQASEQPEPLVSLARQQFLVPD